MHVHRYTYPGKQEAMALSAHYETKVKEIFLIIQCRLSQIKAFGRISVSMHGMPQTGNVMRQREMCDRELKRKEKGGEGLGREGGRKEGRK